MVNALLRRLAEWVFVSLSLTWPLLAQSIQTVAGGGSDDGRSALLAGLQYPTDVAIGPDGNLYFADSRNHRVRKVSSNGVISTVAGNGSLGFQGDGGRALDASFNE